MFSKSFLCSAALLSLANAHGVILAAQGVAGSPASVGFQGDIMLVHHEIGRLIDPALARNCTGISPCQQDTTIIRDAEIAANTVNECGRTELTGNIDVGENTENALAANAVTSVQKGTSMTVTIHQVNADGAGPYACDLDQTSNSGVISQNLSVTNNVPGVNGLSQAKTTDFNITVAMPANLACTGGSTGNICTVRCRNNAVAGPFGGCFAVQQTDVTPTTNSANQINTSQSKSAVDSQVKGNQADLPAAVAANQEQGTTDQLKALSSADANGGTAALGGVAVTTKASPTQSLALDNVGANAAVATTSAAASAKAASTATTGKKGAKGAKNQRRDMSLKWARRSLDGSM
ncbi:hypothetical protein LHYA1_G006839 [Lachnellula hyalina]|uniref:GEgh 16 protein n=1 Tax=Lachnellula hyalina TaxID=1316788 RepID=A0A8H8TZB2_9HELO|nr:uncharacterized protein LHYA1_G006839 [Lachnellula hyalina]TVY24791.1 hypothetical protein LHYA1_G006839 [Lachnellula hyalina]